MFNRILVPLDGSETAARAIPVAARLAKQNDATLHLIGAVQADYPTFAAVVPAEMPTQVPDINEVWNKARGYLEEVADSGHLEGITVTTSVDIGDPAQFIVDTAKDSEVDLIVMTTHGRSGVSRWAFGSVTERVLRHAPCPVLAIREDRPINHILVALDGSEMAERTLEPALELAKRFDAEVTLLRVDDKPIDVDYGSIRSIDNLEPGMGDILARAEYNRADEYVEAVARRYRSEGVRMQWLGIRDRAATGILNIADARGCDVIALSTHGRTGLRRWVYGSVTEKVLRVANRTVLVVRPKID